MAPTQRSPTDSRLGVTRTYFTEFDPLVQQRYGMKDVEQILEQKLKLSSMFNDVVTVAASHLIESETAYEVMTDNAAFLEERIVVPAINSDFESFSELVEKKARNPEEFGSLRTTHVEDIDELYDRADELDERTDSLLTFELGDMTGSFKEGLLAELNDSTSPLYRRVATETDPAGIADVIEEKDVVTRDAILELGEALPQQVRNALFDYTQVNYHLTGGAHHRAGLNLPPQELGVVNEKLSRSISVDAAEIDTSRKPLYQEGLQALLDVLTLDYDPVAHLDSWEFADIHDDTLGREFRQNVEDVIMEIDAHSGTADSSRRLDRTTRELRTEMHNRFTASNPRRERTPWQIQATLHSSNVRRLLFGESPVPDDLNIEDPVIDILLENTSDFVGTEFAIADETAIRETD